MNKKCSLLAMAIGLASGNVWALQALNDDMMQDISGQGGITIEQTSLAQDGFISSSDQIAITQKDYVGSGDVTLTIDGTNTYMYSLDGEGNRTPTTIVRTIDIDADGNLSIKTNNIDFMDTYMGALAIGGKRLTGGSDIEVWKFADGSHLETFIENNPNGAKIKSRTVMTEGSGYSQRNHANGVTTAYDVAYLPATDGDAFRTEVILASDGQGGLRLEMGETHGTVELRNLRLLDTATNTNVFDGEYEDGLAYFDVGYSDIDVRSGYLTLRSANGFNGEVRNGLVGEMASDISVGRIYLSTDDPAKGGSNQFNMNNVSFVVNGKDGEQGEIGYTLEMVDYGRVGGVEMQLVSHHTTADIVIGSLTVSNDTGFESPTIASLALKDFSLEGGTLDVGLYSSAFFAGPDQTEVEGIRQVINADRISFKLTVAGEDLSDPANANQPIVQGDVVINNFVSDHHVGNTKEGIYRVVENSSFSASVNALRAGVRDTSSPHYRGGESGRLVMSNYQQMPGSYMLIEPLRN